MNLKSTIALQAGGPGSGCQGPNCGRKKFYHGTTANVVESIKKNGLYPVGEGGAQKTQDAFTTKGKVYLTVDRDTAMRYAVMRSEQSGKPPAMITFRLPENVHGKLKPDFGDPQGRMLRGRIAPEHFHSAEIFRGKDKEKLYDAAARSLKRMGKQSGLYATGKLSVGSEVMVDGYRGMKGMVRERQGTRLIIQLHNGMVISRAESSVHPWDETHIAGMWKNR